MRLHAVERPLAFLVPYRFSFATPVHINDCSADISILSSHRAAYQQLHLVAGQGYYFPIETLDHTTNFFACCKGFFARHHAHAL